MFVLWRVQRAKGSCGSGQRWPMECLFQAQGLTSWHRWVISMIPASRLNWLTLWSDYLGFHFCKVTVFSECSLTWPGSSLISAFVRIWIPSEFKPSSLSATQVLPDWAGFLGATCGFISELVLISWLSIPRWGVLMKDLSESFANNGSWSSKALSFYRSALFFWCWWRSVPSSTAQLKAENRTLPQAVGSCSWEQGWFALSSRFCWSHQAFQNQDRKPSEFWVDLRLPSQLSTEPQQFDWMVIVWFKWTQASTLRHWALDLACHLQWLEHAGKTSCWCLHSFPSS